MLWVFLAWTAYGLVAVAQSALWWFAVGRRPEVWFNPVLYSFAMVWIYAALTPAVIWLARRHPLRPPRLSRSIAGIIIGGLCITVAAVVLEIAVVQLMPRTIPSPFLILFVDRFNITVFYYIATIAVTMAFDNARVAREQEVARARLAAELSRAQLGALRMQIQPHFLFNTLNTISSMMVRDPDGADAMISRLGDLLRLTLEQGEAQETTVERELEIVRLYVDIEQIRFEEWLTVDIDVDPDVLDARVPPMMLQPLIENAIRHGIAPAARPGSVRVSAHREGADLLLVIEDDGVGFTNGRSSPGHGIGMKATADRLRHLYGADQQMHVERAMPRGTRISIRLPCRTAGTEAMVAAD
jgi:two-component system, LytTR family, sensor kinase